MMNDSNIRSYVRKEIKRTAERLLDGADSLEESFLAEGFFGDIRDRILGYVKKSKKQKPAPSLLSYSNDPDLTNQIIFVQEAGGIYRVEIDNKRAGEPKKVSRKTMEAETRELESAGYTRYTKRDLVKKGLTKNFMKNSIGIFLLSSTVAFNVGIMLLYGMYGDAALHVEGNHGAALSAALSAAFDQVNATPTLADIDAAAANIAANVRLFSEVPSSAEGVTRYEINKNGGLTSYQTLMNLKDAMNSGNVELVNAYGDVFTDYDEFISSYFPDLKNKLTISRFIEKMDSSVERSMWSTAVQFR